MSDPKDSLVTYMDLKKAQEKQEVSWIKLPAYKMELI